MEEFVVTKSEVNGRIVLTYCHPNENGDQVPTFSHLIPIGEINSHLTEFGDNIHLPKSVGDNIHPIPIGECVYERRISKGINKPLQQEYYVMVSCDMGGVIDYMNERGVISDGDMVRVSRLIREHSLSKVQDPDL